MFNKCKEIEISLSKLIKDHYNLATSARWDQLTCWLVLAEQGLLPLSGRGAHKASASQADRQSDCHRRQGRRFLAIVWAYDFWHEILVLFKTPPKGFLAENCVRSQKSPAVFINICSAFLHREWHVFFHRHLHWMHSRNLNITKLINELITFLVHSV